MKQVSESTYKNFRPIERIALFYEAMGRKDYDEADRLMETCPTKLYRCTDTAYGEGVRAINELCFCTRLRIEEASSRMMVCGALLATRAEKEGSEEYEKYAEGYGIALSILRGWWEAWEDFCKSVGVDPRAVMRAAWAGLPHFVENPLMPEVDDELLAEMPEAVAESKACAAEFLRGRWQTYSERTSPPYNR